MKKLVMTIGIVAGLAAATAFAQMRQSASGGMMGAEQSQQMMNKGMMDNMAGIMEQMNGMMQKLSHPMRHLTVTDHAKMQDMGKIMHEMAVQMDEMASHMEKGKLDEATVGRMQERMKALNQSIEALQKKGK